MPESFPRPGSRRGPAPEPVEADLLSLSLPESGTGWPALSWPGKSGLAGISRRRLSGCSATVARVLGAFGAEPGERIAIASFDPATLAVFFLACFRSGLVAVPLAPGLHGPELSLRLFESGVSVALVSDDIALYYRYRSALRQLHGCRLLVAPHMTGGWPLLPWRGKGRAHASVPGRIRDRLPDWESLRKQGMATAGAVALPQPCPEDAALVHYGAGVDSPGLVYSREGLLRLAALAGRCRLPPLPFFSAVGLALFPLAGLLATGQPRDDGAEDEVRCCADGTALLVPGHIRDIPVSARAGRALVRHGLTLVEAAGDHLPVRAWGRPVYSRYFCSHGRFLCVRRRNGSLFPMPPSWLTGTGEMLCPGPEPSAERGSRGPRTVPRAERLPLPGAAGGRRGAGQECGHASTD